MGIFISENLGLSLVQPQIPHFAEAVELLYGLGHLRLGVGEDEHVIHDVPAGGGDAKFEQQSPLEILQGGASGRVDGEEDREVKDGKDPAIPAV